MRVSVLSPFYAAGPARDGLLLGYGGLEPAQMVRGARVLVEVLNRLSVAS